MPIPRKISEFKNTLTNLAQTSHYQVNFGGFSSPLRGYLASRGVDSFFIGETVGLLCSSASLPGSFFATAQIEGNFMGVTERMAHTRQFNQIDFEFYVDRDYKVIKFLEHWMEFISSGSGVAQNDGGYFFRMQYPSDYKISQTTIIKFERDYNIFYDLPYTFFNLYPYAMNSIPVSYSASDILKVSASFYYDRYVCGKVSSLAIHQRTNNNLNPLFSGPSGNRINRLATGRDELINRNLNLGTGRLDDPRPVGVGGPIDSFSPIAYEGSRRAV